MESRVSPISADSFLQSSQCIVLQPFLRTGQHFRECCGGSVSEHDRYVPVQAAAGVAAGMCDAGGGGGGMRKAATGQEQDRTDRSIDEVANENR